MQVFSILFGKWSVGTENGNVYPSSPLFSVYERLHIVFVNFNLSFLTNSYESSQIPGLQRSEHRRNLPIPLVSIQQHLKGSNLRGSNHRSNVAISAMSVRLFVPKYHAISVTSTNAMRSGQSRWMFLGCHNFRHSKRLRIAG